MEKKLKNVTFFLSGDPKKKYPAKVYVTYRVTAGKAISKVKTLVLDDPNTSKPFDEFWQEAYRQIKVTEGIEV